MTGSPSADWWLYLLELANGHLYTGITTNPGRRLSEHESGRGGSRIVRAFRPAKLVALWRIEARGRGVAQSLEHRVKELRAEQKRRLVAMPALLVPLAAEAGVRVSPLSPDAYVGEAESDG